MNTLSPKAVRFIDMAVQRLENPVVSSVWFSRDIDVSGGALPDAVARAALTALQTFEHHLHVELQRSRDEDEISDLSNDLGLVVAIEGDLRRQLSGRSLTD